MSDQNDDEAEIRRFMEYIEGVRPGILWNYCPRVLLVDFYDWLEEHDDRPKQAAFDKRTGELKDERDKLQDRVVNMGVTIDQQLVDIGVLRYSAKDLSHRLSDAQREVNQLKSDNAKQVEDCPHHLVDAIWDGRQAVAQRCRQCGKDLREEGAKPPWHHNWHKPFLFHGTCVAHGAWENSHVGEGCPICAMPRCQTHGMLACATCTKEGK